MFNNFLGGLAGGSGGGGNAPPTAARNGVMFDEIEAMADFTNQLGPPPAADIITQTQGDAPAAGHIFPPAPPGVGGGTNPPPPPPQQAGMGGGHQTPRDAAERCTTRKPFRPSSRCNYGEPRVTWQIGRLSANSWSMCKSSGCIWPCWGIRHMYP